MYDMHLIINTHWDREYRWSFAETQFRLAEAVDDLIDIMNKDEKFAYFHTDSQASMLEDYLDIRPERTEELKELVKSGRILTGPWYTLPAEFLVSGESLTRNLLMGHQIAEGLGNVMKAAYNIFSWGQVSQLPQIYKQFGMDTIIFYRGIDQSELDTLEFIWKAPDGTEALGLTFGSYHRLNFWRYVYLPYILGNQDVKDNGHSMNRDNLGDDAFMFNLCDDNSDDVNHSIINQPCTRNIQGALDGMKELVDTVADKSSVNDLLFLQGFDQENPDPIVTELLDKINDGIDYGKISVASLPEYISIVKEKMIQDKIIEKLPIREGEMLSVEKQGDAFGPLYNGVFSARMPLKMLNAKCQYNLEYWAEPSATWSRILSNKYPSVPLKKAWKEILKNQQHDGIGGCHVDRVTKTMMERYDNVKDISETVTRDALKDLTVQIDFSKLDHQEIGVAVFNSTQFLRSEIITITIDIPSEWHIRNVGGKYSRDFSLHMFDSSGGKVETQLIALEDDTMFGYLKFGNVISFDSTRFTVAFEAKDIAPNGYSIFFIKPVREQQRPTQTISNEPNSMENTYIKAEICANGTISLTDKTSGIKYDRLNYFEDASEKGGPLIFTELFEKDIYNTLSCTPSIALVYNGPLYAKFRVTHEWLLPEGLDAEIKVHVPHGSDWVDKGRLKRSTHKKVVTISTEVILKKGSKQLEFITEVDNTVCDHRLRVMFPTGLSDSKSYYTDSPYDVVERTIKVPDSSGWYEAASKTWPSQSFVSVFDEQRQFTFIHNGMAEYEVTDNMSRTIASTLLRSFGTAGNPTETYRYQDLAQCLGKHTFKYAIGIDASSRVDAPDLLAQAITFNVPLRVAQTTKHKGTLDSRKSFFKLSNQKFIVTTVKEAEYEDGFIIRGYNASEESIDVMIDFDFPVKNVEKVTLEEKSINSIMVKEANVISTTVGKKEIVSFLVKMIS